MSDKALLEKLWQSYAEQPFSKFSLQRNSDLSHDEIHTMLRLLQEMSENGKPVEGYSVKKVASTVYKLIPTKKAALICPTSDAFDPIKGEPLADSPKKQDGSNEIANNSIYEKLPGLLSTSTPKLTRPEQKTQASNQLTAWDYQEHPPQAWIQLIDEGETISTGAYVPDGDGTYHHKIALWRGTHLICTDADEFDAAERFTETKRLLELYPNLKHEAYAIGHSLNSLSHNRPPPHVRARVTFLTESLIDAESFSHLMMGLATVYPIINKSLPPSQPVFGNAGYRRYVEGEKVRVDKHQRFTTRIFNNVLSTARVTELIRTGKAKSAEQAKPTAKNNPKTYDGDLVELTEWLGKHDIPILGQRTGPCQNRGFTTMYLVTCPWENEHTESFGAKDTAVFVDPQSEQWAFHCFHEHCDHRGWEDFRAKVAPRDTREKPTTTARYLSSNRTGYLGSKKGRYLS